MCTLTVDFHSLRTTWPRGHVREHAHALHGALQDYILNIIMCFIWSAKSTALTDLGENLLLYSLGDIKMDRYDKWETHYNRYGIPFQGESAGT